ncbi:hypothetical protein [Sulfurovum sp.]|uniref:hypothetical protein n=1 Tax=Sulfurovum sp. TaxID=1969726 RepID=UPI002867CC33|nr:hypothetical protein [Sulfurovum sp.]
MKQKLLLTLSSLATLGLMTACTSQIPYADTNTDVTKREKECRTIDKKLIKTDKFIAQVQNMSSLHAEEVGMTVPSPQITESSNKKRMLRDANTKRAKLLEEYKRLGCETFKKQ